MHVRDSQRIGALSAGVLAMLLGTAATSSGQVASSHDPRAEAIAAFQRNDLDRAAELSESWLASNPGDEEIQRLLGMVRITAGMALEAEGRPRREYMAVYRQGLVSLLESERLARGQPRPDVNHAVGYVFLMEGQYDEAAARLSRAIEETPGSFVLHRLRGTCRLELGQYLEAEQDLRRAVELNGTDWTSRALHARALHLVGRGGAAREVLRDYLGRIDGASDERRFEVLYEIYRYSMLLNDTEAARGELEAACGIAPSNLVCRTELGILYYRAGLADRAAAELDGVLAASAVPAGLRGDALLYRGLIARQEENLELARRHLREALELSPTRSDALLNYGAVLRTLGATEEARQVMERFQEVVEAEQVARKLTDQLHLDPSDREARVDLIDLWIDLGRWAEAREELEQLRRRHPGDPALPRLDGAVRAGAPESPS